jgi:hypothetical protein|nr:hypothetical protein [uncultured bacterium]
MRIRWLAAAAALVVAFSVASPVPATAAPRWEMTEIPDTTYPTWMNDVVALPSGDAWAAGMHIREGGLFVPTVYATVVWRWDGTRWNDVSPYSVTASEHVSAITGSSGNDIWVMGRSGDNGSSEADGVAHHWDGQAWTTMTIPRDQGKPVVPNDATMVGGEVWAVGFVELAFLDTRAAVVRWNGSSWSKMDVPLPAGDSVLYGVRAAGPNDVWAVGWTKARTSGAFTQPFVVHWDGTRWSRVPTPTSASDVSLSDVEIRGPGEVWVAGSEKWMNQNPPPGPERPFVLRWNGQSWTRTPTPTGQYRTYLSTLGLRDGQLWAGGISTATVLTWNGQTWQVGPTPPGTYLSVTALAGGPNGTLWATGDSSGEMYLARLVG